MNKGTWMLVRRRALCCLQRHRCNFKTDISRVQFIFCRFYVRSNDKADTVYQHTCRFNSADNGIVQLGLTEATEELFFIGKLAGRQDVVYHRNFQGSGIAAARRLLDDEEC